MNLADVSIFDLGIIDKNLILGTLVCSAIAAVCAIISVVFVGVDIYRKKKEFEQQHAMHLLELNYEHKLKCYSEFLGLTDLDKYTTVANIRDYLHSLAVSFAKAQLICNEDTLPLLGNLFNAMFDKIEGKKTTANKEFNIASANCKVAFRKEIHETYVIPFNTRTKIRRKKSKKR